MKTTLRVVVVCLFASASHAQSGFNMYYLFSTSPVTQLKSTHGCGFDFYFKVKNSGYSSGLSYSNSVYGTSNEPLQIVTSDGGFLNTNLSITNSYHSINLYHRYHFGKFSKIIFPFAEARTGWNFFRTRLYIEDPEDESNCKPLEDDVLHKDNTWSVTAGGGADIRLGGQGFKEHQGWFFTFSVGYAMGGKVSYMHTGNEAYVNGPHGQHTAQAEGKSTVEPYYSKFINTQTQVVHEHHTGYVYTSSVYNFYVRAGFSLRF